MIKLYPNTSKAIRSSFVPVKNPSFESLWRQTNYLLIQRVASLVNPVESINVEQIGNQFLKLADEIDVQYSYDLFVEFLEVLLSVELSYDEKVDLIKNLLKWMLHNGDESFKKKFVPLMEELYKAGLQKENLDRILRT